MEALVTKLAIIFVNGVFFISGGWLIFKGHYSEYSESFDRHIDEITGTAFGGASGLYFYFSNSPILDIDILGIWLFVFGIVKAIGFSALGSSVGFFVSRFLKKKFDK